jgi:hypothetical protein
VKLHHMLCKVEADIDSLGKTYRKTNRLDYPAVDSLYQRTVEVRDDFISALKGCAALIQPNTGTDTPFFRVYKPFLESVYENDHTVLPQFKYMQIYFYSLEYQVSSGKEREMGPTGGMAGLWRFIGERTVHASETIRSYNCMLSESLDESMKTFNLERMVQSILNIQKTSFIVNYVNSHGGKKNNMEIYRMAKRKVNKDATFTSSFNGQIEGIRSIVYQLLHLLLSNSFKATFAAEWHSLGRIIAERTGLAEYSSLPDLPPPRIAVSVSEAQGDKVAIRIADNGIGMTNARLYQLLSAEKPFSAFSAYAISGGRSMQVVPYMMDYVGDLHGSSAIGEGTTWEILIPKKQAFN